MPKELYLYSPIMDFTSELLISQMEEARDEDVVIRINTPGGAVFSGWGIVAKMREHKGKVNLKVDGAAMSMGAMLLPFADRVEALDVSTIMLHRADMYVESEEDQKFLDGINKELKAKLKIKVDSDKLKELKGVTVDQLFAGKERIDLFLSAKEAKSIGLVDKIVKLTAKEAEAFNDKFFNIAAKAEKEIVKPKVEDKMTLQELKEKHPDVYAQAVETGANRERDRVEAWMTFVDVDHEAVAKGVSEGKEISAKVMAELNRKAFSASALKNIESDSPRPVETGEDTGKAESDQKLSAFEAEARAALGLK